MQYILSEEEYNDFINNEAKQLKEKDKIIFVLCQKIANNIPFTYWEFKKPRLWKCIISTDNDKSSYCDECQVRYICTYPNKKYSK